MEYIHRDIEEQILFWSKTKPCILITGPQQVGKTCTLLQLKEAARTYVSLADMETRYLASENPTLFFKTQPLPILIDDIQYVPTLLTHIANIMISSKDSKLYAPGSIWISGSLTPELTEVIKNLPFFSVLKLSLYPLTQHELYGYNTSDIQLFKLPLNNRVPATLPQLYERIINGSLPKIHSNDTLDRNTFYANYANTYIEYIFQTLKLRIKDQKFFYFMRQVALQIGKVGNIHAIAKTIRISNDTAKRWLSILEDSGIIFYLDSYSNDDLKRTLKKPKLYFFDTGFACYLMKITSATELMHHEYAQVLLKNYVISEIKKIESITRRHYSLQYYQDKEGHEIDLIAIKKRMFMNEFNAIQIRESSKDAKELFNTTFSVLNKLSIPHTRSILFCSCEHSFVQENNEKILPIWSI